VVKSHGAERSGKGCPRGSQVWIKEMNENEPLMKCREVATICQKLVIMTNSEEHSRNLFTGCAAGVIQAA